MMKLLTVITAMMISFAAFGQDTLNQKTSNQYKRLLIGVNFSPDVCYRTLLSNDVSSYIPTIINIRNKSETIKYGYTAGLNICYNISTHWGIEGGMQYSNKGYAMDKMELTFGDMIDKVYANAYASSFKAPTAVKFIYNHIYFDVPVRAIFSFGEKRIHFMTSIGVTTNILLNSTQTTILEYEDGSTKRSTNKYHWYNGYQSIDISPTISAGIDYRINRRMNLRIEPTFRYGLLTIEDAPIKTYLWNGGLNVAFYYGIK